MNAVTLNRVLLLVLVAAAIQAIPASAQMAPMGMSPMGVAPPGGGPTQWPSSQPPPCLAAFLKLRDVVEKTGLAAKAAHEHHASREEMCKIIQTFSGSEEKMVSYAAANVTTCGIPAEAVKQMKSNHEHTVKVREQVCAAGPTAGPVAPTLSDALGTNSLAIDSIKSSRTSTFNTLTGNPLKQ
jgi:hypothetical protein